MTLARWFIAASWLLLFWLLAATAVAPALQRRLNSAAQPLLAAKDSDYPPLQVSFDGQHAILRGQVRRPEARAAAEARARQELRTRSAWAFGLDSRFNPVTAVTNEIKVTPFPPGWLMLVGQGTYGRLIGAAATEFEARDSAARVRELWSARGGTVETHVVADSGRFDEAPEGEQTLAATPPPRDAGGDSTQIQIARIGGDWRRLPVEAADTQLRAEVAALGLSEADWQELALPAIQAARRHLQAERAREEQRRQQAELPPPHVFLAARDRRLLLIGEVASLGIKREFLNSVIATFPDWRVIDDVRVSARRRTEGDFGPITTALLPQADAKGPGKSLMLGLSGAGWQAVDWEVGREARPWAESLPKELPADLLARDSIVASEWLQGEARGIPALPLRAQPSFLTLTLLPDRVILAGQLAEESLRSQLIEAARRVYGNQAEVMAEALLARGTCEPAADVQQTVRSLPPLPREGEAAVLAFAIPGQVWKVKPATPPMLEPGGLARAGLLPASFPAPMAEDTFAEAFDYVRASWQKRRSTAASVPGAP